MTCAINIHTCSEAKPSTQMNEHEKKQTRVQKKKHRIEEGKDGGRKASRETKNTRRRESKANDAIPWLLAKA